MNKKLLALLAACAVGLLALTYSGSAQNAPTPTPPSSPGAPGAWRHNHPAIRAAIRALERAKAEMQAAAHDYGGHRQAALAACDNAINQLQLALQYVGQNNPANPPAPANP